MSAELMQHAANVALLDGAQTADIQAQWDASDEQMGSLGETLTLQGAMLTTDTLMAESLESYVNGFMNAVPDGDWNSRTAAQYQVGMESILRVSGLQLPASMYAVSFESAEATTTPAENKSGTVQKSKNLIQKAWAAVVAAVGTFITNMIAYVQQIGKNGAAMKKAGADIGAKATGLKGNPKQAQYDAAPKWAKYLYQANTARAPQVVLAAVTTAGTKLCTDWLTAHNAMADSVRAGVQSGTALDFAASVTSLNTFAGEMGAWPNQVTLTCPKPGGNDLTALLAVKPAVTKGDLPAQAKVNVLSINDVKAVAESISAVGDAMLKIETSMKNSQKLITALQSVVKSLASSGDKPKVTVKATDVSAILAKMLVGPRAILPLMADVARGAYNHAITSIKMYDGSEAATATEAVPDPDTKEKKDDAA